MDELFLQQLMEGKTIECTCCGQHCRRAKMRIHSTIAAMLCQLHRMALRNTGEHGGWVHLSIFKPLRTSGNDFSIVKHWGLARSKPTDDDEKNSSGMWQLTSRGIAFVEGRELIAKHVFVFDNQVLDVADERVGISDCLGKKFNFAELFS